MTSIKRVILSFALILIAQMVLAQGASVVSAYNYMNSGDLDKAKAAIDKAALHEKTSGWAKTWYYRGKIYLAIHRSENEKYKSLDKNALIVANESFSKAISLDTRRIDKNDLMLNYNIASNLAFQEGVTYYNAADYATAINYFTRTAASKEDMQVVDSLSIFNIGLCAENLKDYDKALESYKKCAEIGYGGSRIYSNIAFIYVNQEKDEEAFKVLKDARAKYPQDQDLLTTEINLYLKYNRLGEALENLNITIQNDPSNAVFYYARGTIYNNQKENEKAEADYLKAIELKDDYFDAYYNLGALYFNQGADMNNEVNQISDDAEYQKGKKKVDEMFKKALPYLEKAYEIDPENQGTISSLKQLYARTGQMDKYNEMNEKLNN